MASKASRQDDRSGEDTRLPERAETNRDPQQQQQQQGKPGAVQSRRQQGEAPARPTRFTDWAAI